MILAVHDIRRGLPQFLGIGAGVGLLFTVVLAMAGIYAGLVEDSVSLARAMDADLWVVQAETRGPFADASRVDPSLEDRLSVVPHVTRSRAYTYQMLERVQPRGTLRFAMVGVSFPDDRGDGLPLVAGRGLRQGSGEAVADRSLGLRIGDVLTLGDRDLRVVGLTQGTVTFGGEGLLFAAIRDAQAIAFDDAGDARRMQVERTVSRLRDTELGRTAPALEDLAADPRWQRPGVADPPLAAVLVNVDAAANVERVRAALASWPDVAVHSQGEEERFLVEGVVQRARMQLFIFSVILTITAALIVALLVYNRVLEKTHDIAILGLIGLHRGRIVRMIVVEAWLIGLLAWAVALLVGDIAFPHFARRIVLTPQIHMLAPVVALLVTSIASAAGVRHALRVDVGKVLEA